MNTGDIATEKMWVCTMLQHSHTIPSNGARGICVCDVEMYTLKVVVLECVEIILCSTSDHLIPFKRSDVNSIERRKEVGI
jgi:hypothetical protein